MREVLRQTKDIKMISTFEVQRKIQEAVFYYSEILNNKGYSFIPPNIDFNLKGQVAGKGGPNILKFNLDLASRNLKTFLKTTVPHEIAHVIQLRQNPRSKPHGSEWKFFCKLLTGHYLPRCHDYEVVSRNSNQILASCSCQQFSLTRIRVRRIQQGVQYRCKKCRQIIKIS